MHSTFGSTFAFALALVAAMAGSGTAARIGLYGDSFMPPVAAALDLVRLPYERIASGSLATVSPDSLDALFISYDASDDDATVQWIESFRASGGKLFTFFLLSDRLLQLQGIDQGDFEAAHYDGQFAQIRSLNVLPHLPETVFQDSWNVHFATPSADSVQVAAHWHDASGRDTGFPALLVGPGGAHLTHVYLGDDPQGAARLFIALLAEFFPDVWAQAVRGALAAGARVGGGSDALSTRSANDSRALEFLRQASEARRDAEEYRAAARFGNALESALRYRHLLAAAYARSQMCRAGEFRGVWVNDPPRMNGGSGWKRACRELAGAGFNAVVVKVETSAQLSRVKSRSTDHLRTALEAARDTGIEIHAWRRIYNLEGSPDSLLERLRDENRLQMSADRASIPWLCPSHPDNFAREVEAVANLVRRYDLDGVHLDYIRYPGSIYCYDDGCRIRFAAQTGHHPTSWPDDVISGRLVGPFQNWRREQISRLVRTVSLRVRSIRPGVRVSAAVFSDWSQVRRSLGQDWIQWIDEGYLDFVCPMNYTRDLERFRQLVRRQVNWVDGRIPLYIGIGAWRMPAADEVIQQVESARQLGADGFIMFDYDDAFARRTLPALSEGLAANRALPPHWGPYASFEIRGEPGGEESAGTPIYPEMGAVAVTTRIVPSSLASSVNASVSLRRLDDELVFRLGQIGTRVRRWLPFLSTQREGVHVSDRLSLLSGDYRPVLEGTFRNAKGRIKRFIRRGPILRVRSQTLIDSLERAVILDSTEERLAR